MVRVPRDDADETETAAFRRALGIPDTPDAYEINLSTDFLDIDPDVNGRLHAAHFTPRQPGRYRTRSAEPVRWQCVITLCAQLQPKAPAPLRTRRGRRLSEG